MHVPDVGAVCKTKPNQTRVMATRRSRNQEEGQEADRRSGRPEQGTLEERPARGLLNDSCGSEEWPIKIAVPRAH